MAVIFTADHEANNFSEWSGTFGTEPQLAGGAVALNGSVGFFVNRASTNEYKVKDYQANANSHHFFSFFLKIRIAPSAINTCFNISKTDGSGTVAQIRVNTDRTLVFRNGSSDIGSPSPALNLNQTYRVEVEVDMTPSTGSCVIRARLDLVQFAESLVETKNSFGRILAGGGNTATKDFCLDYFIADDAAFPGGDPPIAGLRIFGDEGLVH